MYGEIILLDLVLLGQFHSKLWMGQMIHMVPPHQRLDPQSPYEPIVSMSA